MGVILPVFSQWEESSVDIPLHHPFFSFFCLIYLYPFNTKILEPPCITQLSFKLLTNNAFNSSYKIYISLWIVEMHSTKNIHMLRHIWLSLWLGIICVCTYNFFKLTIFKFVVIIVSVVVIII